ncbi:MAG: hypothetical protein ACYDAH_20340, partial [Steroidobacteraceae bacterium]
TQRPIAAADAAGLHDVFVSYASQDASVANAIVAALERNGLRCLRYAAAGLGGAHVSGHRLR